MAGIIIRNRGLILAAVITFAFSSIPALAHHGTAAYDMDRLLTMKGTVTEVDWGNPHTEIYFDVKTEQGNTVHWACISHSPNKLARSGWTKDAVQPGDEVTVIFHPAKNGSHIGLLKELVLPDGKELGAPDIPY